MKILFIILLLASTPLATSATESGDAEYQDESFSISDFSFSQSASLSIFDRIPCVFRGEIQFHGQIWHAGPCVKCRCTNGTTSCHVESCQTELLCQAAETVVEEGECCPHCRHSNPSGNCSFRGTIYQPKQRVHLDPCTECTCEIHGHMKCHIRSCPSESGCSPTELVVKPDLCCPVCPYKLVVEGVRISHDKENSLEEDTLNTVRFSVHVAVNKKMSSRTVKGEHLWRLSAWISENKDGFGPRMFYQPNIFNEQHAAKSFHRQDTARFKWFGLRYRIEHGEDPPGSYLCVEFDKEKYPRPLYNLSFTFYPLDEMRENLVGCIAIRTLTG